MAVETAPPKSAAMAPVPHCAQRRQRPKPSVATKRQAVSTGPRGTECEGAFHTMKPQQSLLCRDRLLLSFAGSNRGPATALICSSRLRVCYPSILVSCGYPPPRLGRADRGVARLAL
jgi:hypothetical protein